VNRDYGEYTLVWERSEGEATSIMTGPTLQLRSHAVGDLESLRGPDWPESLWQALREQYPLAFLRSFLRTEFRDPLSDTEAARLRRIFTTELTVDEYQRQVDEFNTEMHAQQSDRASHRASVNAEDQAPNGRSQLDGTGETMSLNAFVQSLEPRETLIESDSDVSFEGGADRDSLNTSQNMMDLLYHIGGEQARRAYYIHRGVQCNSCGALPIQGIRYHCVNCFDYDLCEACEAGQVHIKTHVFLKIRLPGPTRGSVKDVTPPWYPGKPEMTRETLPQSVSRNLLKNTKIDKTELDALYDQFRSLAGAPYESDSLGIGMAINRSGFDQYFAISNTSRHSPPLLLYDRIFAFYDTNNDGLIDFEEFIKGLMNLQDDTRDVKLRRIFRGYDLDDDGYVNRRDFLRMFRSYYAYIKEINREVVAHFEEENSADGIRELLESSQPISAAFTGVIPHGHASRTGFGKAAGPDGDLISSDENGALEDDHEAHADRNAMIAAAAMSPRGNLRNTHPSHIQTEHFRPNAFRGSSDPEQAVVVHDDDATANNTEGDDSEMRNFGRLRPDHNIETTDVVSALGRDVPLEEITDPVDQARVRRVQTARLQIEEIRDQQERADKVLEERWRRRQFFTDQEEGMTKPPGYTEEDSSDDEDKPLPANSNTNSAFVSRRPSMRSRSSSKVRFEDSLTDTDYETRSNTSSRSVPVNERWGGFELSEAEREIGKEILYQTVQQSYNELLDILFKEKEDLYLAAKMTNAERKARADEIRKYKEQQDTKTDREEDALRAADMLRTEELFATAVSGDARMSPSLALDPETASISSHNAQIESVDSPSVDIVTESELRRDPTLPQFRPDHVSPVSPKAVPSDLPLKPRHPLSKAALAALVLHEACEVEAKERGGAGKISFDEFAAKMVEDQGDEVEKALGRLGKDEDKEGKWPKSAGLGKLQFIGAWLEWASF
jgi:Zinc finger, ZZ type/EF hand